MRSVSLSFVVTCILTVSTASSELRVSPTQATHFSNDEVSLTCFYEHVYSLHWSLLQVGAWEELIVYISGVGISFNYRSAGRHSVELNATAGSCHLHIRNISMEDAGTYICRRDDGATVESELTVLGTKPMCSSNTSLTRVLVENDCDLEPDHVELNCSVAYRGNIPPLLEWHHSSKSDVEMERYVVDRWTSADISVVMHYMTVKLDWKFNGSNFVCALKDVNERIGCATENISVVYFFRTPPIHMATEYGDNMINVSCIANTSEPCSYQWKATEVRTNNPLDIHRQTISLIPKNYDDVKCFAECKIANKDCATQPMDWKLSEAEAGDGTEKRVVVAVVLGLILGLIIGCASLAILFIFRRRLTGNAAKNLSSTLLQLVKPLHQATSPPSQTFVDSRGRGILPQGQTLASHAKGNRINAAARLQLPMQRSSCIDGQIAILLLKRAEDNGTQPEHGRNTAGIRPKHINFVFHLRRQ